MLKVTRIKDDFSDDNSNNQKQKSILSRVTQYVSSGWQNNSLECALYHRRCLITLALMRGRWISSWSSKSLNTIRKLAILHTRHQNTCPQKKRFLQLVNTLVQIWRGTNTLLNFDDRLDFFVIIQLKLNTHLNKSVMYWLNYQIECSLRDKSTT